MGQKIHILRKLVLEISYILGDVNVSTLSPTNGEKSAHNLEILHTVWIFFLGGVNQLSLLFQNRQHSAKD